MRAAQQPISQAAQSWATARNVDLRSLDATQQRQVIADVSAETGVPRAEVMNQLVALWSAANDARGGDAMAMLGDKRALPNAALGSTPPRMNALNAQLAARMGEVDTLKRLDPSQVSFANAADVISSAQKFILPLPKLDGGGEPLVYPKGHEKAGQAVTDWQGKPIGERGVVFHNDKDDAVQAAKADGNSVVIINQVSEEQAAALMKHLNGRDPNKLSLSEVKETLSFARDELGLGDMYNSDRDFIKSKMNALEDHASGLEAFGLHRRDDRDVCNAVFVEGKGEFTGSATTHKFEDGAVVLRQMDSKTKEYGYRVVQPDTFAETYRNKDGSPIDLDALPRS